MNSLTEKRRAYRRDLWLAEQGDVRAKNRVLFSRMEFLVEKAHRRHYPHLVFWERFKKVLSMEFSKMLAIFKKKDLTRKRP